MPTTSMTRGLPPVTSKTAGIGQHHELIDQQSDRPQHHSDQAEQRKPSELVVDKILRQVPRETGRPRPPWRWRRLATRTMRHPCLSMVFPIRLPGCGASTAPLDLLEVQHN